MTTTTTQSNHILWNLVKKTIPLTLFVNVVSIAVAYGFYALAFRVSLAPFWLATAMLIVAVVGPCVIVLIDRDQSRLVSLGLANAIMVAAFYFFFGIVCFFFYFLFAPMPLYAKAGGLALGITLTGYWMAFTARDVNKALATSRFVHQAFEDKGSVLQYRLQSIAKLEAVLSSRSPSGKVHMYLVLLIAPLSLVIARILTPVFGAHGPILLVALILFPVSQWIAAIGVRQYIVMIRLPRKLERTQGKLVVVVSDDVH
ncbi:hypothetical protein AB4Y40_28870 [Paraburkholderia sp. EG287B]|uniref:hypothetical protein n=1 Tax=unclassified Paraburkholderia TaxID=2615204 RepID=UPI0034D30D02